MVSGDLTQRARPAQFRAAWRFLSGLDRPLVWTPGNHDVPLYRFWERFFAPFWMWRRCFAPECVRGSISPSWAIVAINTAHGWTTKHGRVRAEDRNRVARELARTPPGVPRFLVAHHPLLPVSELGREPAASGGASLARLARELGVELVFSGHLHWGFFVPGSSLSPPLLHAGTSASSRGRGPERGVCSLNWVEWQRERIEIVRRIWKPGSRDFAPVERWSLPRAPG